MNIINKFIPKNPINSTTMDRITDKIKNVLEVFGKNYAKQTQLVLVRNKEAEIEKKEIRNAKIKKDKESKTKYYKKKFGEESDVPNFPAIPEKGASLEVMTDYCKKMLDLGFKPLFPRGKMEPLKSPELKVELTRYVLRDEEYDPYAAYIIKVSKGNFSCEKERRFKEFEKLNKAIKKLLPAEAKLPSASSKIGVRNLTPEFLSNRVTELNNYMQKICVESAIQENEAFQKFVGLFKTDPLDDQIFEAAFRQTKWHFWCWGDFKYDEPGDALTKLITIEVWRTVRSDVYAALPSVEAPRKASLKLAFKLIASPISAAIPPAWDAAYSASKAVRGKITSVLDSVISLVIEKKNELNNKLKDKMMESFVPIKEAIGKVFAAGIHQVVPPIVEPFSSIYKTYQVKAEPIILQALKECDSGKLKEGIQVMNGIHEKMVARLNEKVDEQLQVICEKLNGAVTLTLLRDCFNPMKAIGRIISDFVRIINPHHWGVVAAKCLEYKKQLCSCNGDNVDKILYDMERNALYDMRWEAWSMDGARYSLRYHIYALKLDLDSIAETCFDLGKIVIKQIYKKSMKKFIRKFSDYVWGFSVRKEDDKSWSEKVDEAMEMAYQAAKHKFNKECGNIIKRGVCDILGGVIVNKVIEEIIKIVEPIIKTLSDALPDNIKDMLDLEEMAKNDIQEVLTGTFEGAVYDQDGPFTEELNKAIENCQI